MITIDQKKRIIKLLDEGWTIPGAAASLKLPEAEVITFVRTLTPQIIREIQRAPSPKAKSAPPKDLYKTHAPSHLIKLANKWREKHGDQLVVRLPR